MKLGRIILVLLFLILLWAALSVAIHWALYQNTLGLDSFVYYTAARALFLDHLSPYNQEVTDIIQLGIHQRLAFPWEDQNAFVYPPYSLLIFLPLCRLPFDWAQAIWLAANLVIMQSLLLLALPRAPRWLSLSALFLYPFCFGLILGNFAVLLGMIILVLFTGLLTSDRPGRPLQILLGIALAWATCKPQFMWLFVIFFLVTAGKQKLWPFLYSFLISMTTLILASFAMTSTWVSRMIDRVTAYSEYNHSWPTLTHFLLQGLSQNTAILLSLVIFFILAGISLRWFILWWKESFSSLALFAWCGMLTYLVHPNSSPFEQLTFVIPTLVWVGQNKEDNKRGVMLFWLGGILVYWIVFIIGRLPETPLTIHDWPVLYYLPWLVWLIIQNHHPLPGHLHHIDKLRV